MVSRAAATAAAILILLGMLASPAMAANVVAPNAGDVDVDADAKIGDANTGTTVDSGNTNTDASVNNSVNNSGNTTTDASVGSHNTTASYNKTQTTVEANDNRVATVDHNDVGNNVGNNTGNNNLNPQTVVVTKTGDVASNNASNNQVAVVPTIVLPVLSGNSLVVNDVVDVGLNCSVLAHCEDNDTVNDNDSCNFSSCNQDNDSVNINDRSTNIGHSFNGNRDSFNGAEFALGQDSIISIVRDRPDSIDYFVREVQKRPILRQVSSSTRDVKGGELAYTGMPEHFFPMLWGALMLICVGVWCEWLGRNHKLQALPA